MQTLETGAESTSVVVEPKVDSAEVVEQGVASEPEETPEGEKPSDESHEQLEAGDAEGSSDSGDDGGSIDADDQIRVTIGDDEPPEDEVQAAPEWVKEVRKRNREIAKENKQLKKRLEEIETVEKKPAALGSKPTLEGCDYDSDVYEAKLDQWYQAKREHDAAAEQKKVAAEQKQKELQLVVKEYEESKAKLASSVGDEVEEAEAVFAEIFNETQQGLILDGANDKGTVVFALGKNPKKAKALAAIKSPAKFCAELGRIEAKMKVTKRKPKTTPEPTVKAGTARASGGGDAVLEQLREDADRTGNYSKVMAYKRKIRESREKR